MDEPSGNWTPERSNGPLPPAVKSSSEPSGDWRPETTNGPLPPAVRGGGEPSGEFRPERSNGPPAPTVQKNPRSSFLQPNFIGGEWAPEAYGRQDLPAYRTAMKLCQNTIPVEAGANVRRSGTEWLGPTYSRGAAKLIAFVPASTTPYVGEFTNAHIKFWLGGSPVFATTSPITSTVATYDGSYFTLTFASTTGWSVGDLVMLSFPASYDPTLETGMRNRVLQIRSLTATTLTLSNDINGVLSGFTLPTGGLVGAVVYKILLLGGTPWTTEAQLLALRSVQVGNTQIILSSAAAPRLLTNTVATTVASMDGIDDRLYMVTSETDDSDCAVEMLRPFFGQTDDIEESFFVDRGSAKRAIVTATFTLATATFLDGPYNDPQTDTGTVSAGSGSGVTFTPASSTFVAADVGRQIRLLSEPATWASGTTYAANALVTYQGAYWQSNAGSNTGNTPGTAPISSGVNTTWWSPAPNSLRWAWGTITAQGGSSCTFTYGSAIDGGATSSLPTSVNGSTITSWRLGTYQSGAYPTCGTYHEGRIWLAGAVGNRFDGSMSNVSLTFSPTDQYGNVNDNSAISETLNSAAVDTIYWLEPDYQGLLLGTLGGEWLVQASSLNDPLTPTSIQAHRVTKYGCANIEPKRTGMALVYVQRYGRRLMEYLADSLSGRFTGRHLNQYSAHLSESGIAEIVYNEEPAPVLWCRMNDGSLVGVTYRRVSRFVTEEPALNAWHRHTVAGP